MVREPAEKQCRQRRRCAKNADSESSGGGIEAFAQGDPDQMYGLEQTYTARKSRCEQQDHRTITQLRKTFSPTYPIAPGGRGIIRIARTEPTERKCQRQQQDTTGEGGGAPIEPFDQEVKQRGKTPGSAAKPSV
jgi:hypothetical protein